MTILFIDENTAKFVQREFTLLNTSEIEEMKYEEEKEIPKMK